MRRYLFLLGLISGAVLLAPPAAALGDLVLPIDPKSGFLRTNLDPDPVDAAPLELASLGLGITPGVYLRLETLGAYSSTGGSTDSSRSLIGVFSSTAALDSGGSLNRVLDAIDAGVDVVTAPTFFGGVSTDILEDFEISSTTDPITEVTIQVPDGAAYLFVGVRDTYYSDNTDPNGDFSLRISVVSIPEPASVLTLGLVSATFFACHRRRGPSSEG